MANKSGISSTTEPTVGEATTYTVVCTSSEGTTFNTLTVTTRGLAIVIASPAIIRPDTHGGGVSTISWDTKGSTACTMFGIGLPNSLGSNTVGNQLFTGIESSQTVTISCSGGTRSALDYVIPKHFEE